MFEHPHLVSGLLFLLVGAMYSSVGHGGSSGYLALMSLLSVQSAAARPAVLVLNCMVAAITLSQFAAAGRVPFRLAWPMCLMSIPWAYAGGRISLPQASFGLVVGVILLVSAVRMVVRRDPDRLVAECNPSVPTSLVAGGSVGLLAGVCGVGGGVFFGPLLILRSWAMPDAAAGASAMLSLGNSAAGLAALSGESWSVPEGLPAWAAGAATGGVLGSTYGSRFSQSSSLRAVLAAVLVFAGVKLMMR